MKRTNIQNYDRALKALKRSVATKITEPRDMSGIIKDFELVYELAWKALKAFLEAEGHETRSAKHSFATAFRLGYIADESIWIEIVKDRNLTVHTYDEAFAKGMCTRINGYVKELEELYATLEKN